MCAFFRKLTDSQVLFKFSIIKNPFLDKYDAYKRVVVVCAIIALKKEAKRKRQIMRPGVEKRR